MAFKRGPMSDADKQAISDGWARRKAGAPTKKERRAADAAVKAAAPPLTKLGKIRKLHSVHRYEGDGSGYKTFNEIGRICGVSSNAVNVIYLRAVRKIAEELVSSQRVDGGEPADRAVERIMSMQALEELIIEALQSSVARPDHRLGGCRSVS